MGNPRVIYRTPVDTITFHSDQLGAAKRLATKRIRDQIGIGECQVDNIVASLLMSDSFD